MKQSRQNTAVGSSGQRSVRHRRLADVYVQKDSPGAGKEANWLPAPDGPFYCIMRIYMPKPAVFSGQWKQPPLQRLAKV